MKHLTISPPSKVKKKKIEIQSDNTIMATIIYEDGTIVVTKMSPDGKCDVNFNRPYKISKNNEITFVK